MKKNKETEENLKMNILYQPIKYIFFIILLLLFMAAGQFGQLMRSNDDVRNHVLES